ncbi:MAG: hypothetical protein ACK5X3_21760 [Pseudomonadota bacterium]|jgi:hypothetical protein
MSTTIVYRCPGRHLITNGVTFDTLGIEIADFDKALSEGWHETVPAAIEAFTAPAASQSSEKRTAVPVAEKPSFRDRDSGDGGVAPTPDGSAPNFDVDNAPPTRAEMLQQAEILGIKIDKRWSDDTLLFKIQAAMRPGATDNDPI